MHHQLTTRLTALAFAVLTTSIYAAETRKPNVLLIVADDLGYGELGIQGFARDIPTPNIDSIAQNGIRFTNGYVTGPYCSPTRAALLSGRHQARFGHEFNPGPARDPADKVGLDVSQKTLGDHLKAAGYATAWIGKSHLGNSPEFHPLRRGFDTFFGFLGGAHQFIANTENQRDPIQRDGSPVEKPGYLTDEFAKEAVDFIHKQQGKPWLTYLAFNAVHSPLESTEKYLSRFPGISDEKRRKFAAHLSALDDGVGAVLSALRQTAQEENTLVFFFSDNGGPTPSTTSGNGPLRGFKAQTWEGGVRVPWMVQWKGHFPAGKVDDRAVVQLDILPTALAAAGVTPQAEWKLDGVNLLPYLQGEKADAPHEALYWRFGQQLAIRKGDWKLVKGAGPGRNGEDRSETATTTGAQLFNLRDDIGETTDLAGKEPEKVKELAAAWNAWDAGNVPPKWLPGPGRKKAKADAAVASASTEGPWKSGDVVIAKDAPKVAQHAFQVSANIESAGANGVVVAQGGKAHGFALFVQDGKLSLALRVKRELTVITAQKPIEPGKRRVGARLAADGKVTLTVDDQVVGEGQGTLLGAQPGEGLTIGNDGGAAVGEYASPNDFKGTVEGATVKVL